MYNNQGVVHLIHINHKLKGHATRSKKARTAKRSR